MAKVKSLSKCSIWAGYNPNLKCWTRLKVFAVDKRHSLFSLDIDDERKAFFLHGHLLDATNRLKGSGRIKPRMSWSGIKTGSSKSLLQLIVLMKLLHLLLLLLFLMVVLLLLNEVRYVGKSFLSLDKIEGGLHLLQRVRLEVAQGQQPLQVLLKQGHQGKTIEQYS